MAIENHTILNGQIRSLRAVKKKETGEIMQIGIGLLVMRRPSASIGNKNGQTRMDIVQIRVRSREWIDYLVENKATENDMLEVSGVFCTVREMKRFVCKKCGEMTMYEGSISYVHPLCMRLDRIHPINYEVIHLSETECSSKENILRLLNERKTQKGEIIRTHNAGKTEWGNLVKIAVREPVKENDVREWLTKMSDISNRIYIMGNLCNDPFYMVNETGGRSCSYQLGINRKVFIKEDDPEQRADFPYIKSINDQADKDNKSLSKGSLVFIEGSIQAREGFIVEKTCSHCGALCKLSGDAMEIVPYAVEYLKNCNTDYSIENEAEELYYDEEDG